MDGELADLEVPATFRESVRPDDFSVEVIVVDGRTVVVVQGEVDVLTAALLWERVEETISSSDGALVLDLAGLRFVDSMGLGVMVRAHKRLNEADRRLILRSPSEQARKLFAVTGLYRVFEVEA
ncbi:MAG: STAS domain-containing protein [Acidimicrobiia bacterium]